MDYLINVFKNIIKGDWIPKPGIVMVVLLICLLIAGGIMGQIQYSGSTISATITNATLAVTQSGTWSDRMQDGSGTALTSTGSALDVNLKSGALLAGTALIGKIAPLTACGTTIYNSGPINLPNSITSLTSTDTCIEAVYCVSLDTTTVHPLTVMDQSTACNSGTCNIIPPTYSLNALADVRFPKGFVKATGGIKWNTDAINKVTCWVEGLQ